MTSAAAWGSYRSEQSVAQETALAIAANGPSGIVNALQNERDMATADLVGVAGQANLPVKSNADARQKTDAALSAFRSSVDAAGGPTLKVFQPAVDALAQLGAARAQVDGFHGTRALANPQARVADVVAFGRYASLIGAFLQAVAIAPQHISDPALRSSVETLDLFLNQSESLTTVAQQMFAASILEPDGSPGSIVPGVDLGNFEVWTNRLASFTAGPDGPVVAGVVRSAKTAAQAMAPFAQDATTGHPLNVVAFETALDPIGNVWQAAAGTVGQHISQRAASLRHSAELRAAAYAGAALLTILFGIVVLLRVSRSISRPLTQLAGDARRIAEQDLPAAVDAIFNPDRAESQDAGAEATAPRPLATLYEVGQVQGALDEVQRKALELATEQADLRHKVADAFINLGRRNQNLVSRQLELITQIEQQEEDPATLEDLFRLDHLTTRMRRHAESLLVIAGSGAVRSWAEAASAVDVVRAGSAEVEDYQRLRLHHFDHAVISASATTDLVHILAELLENGLAFSPPHAAVGLYGRALENGYTISVVDAGIGMTPEARDAANRRLASGGDLDDAASRCLGLVVAGRLAARHGITITLHDSEAGGVTARVTIPAALIESSVAGAVETGGAPLSLESPSGEPITSRTNSLPLGDDPFTPDSAREIRPGQPSPAAAEPDRDGGSVPAPDVRLGALPVPAAAQTSPAESRFRVAPQVPSTPREPAGSHFAAGSPLPQRTPGASLGDADDSLRRDRTPATQTPWAVSYALTDYLNNRAEPPAGRPARRRADHAPDHCRRPHLQLAAGQLRGNQRRRVRRRRRLLRRAADGHVPHPRPGRRRAGRGHHLRVGRPGPGVVARLWMGAVAAGDRGHGRRVPVRVEHLRRQQPGGRRRSNVRHRPGRLPDLGPDRADRHPPHP